MGGALVFVIVIKRTLLDFLLSSHLYSILLRSAPEAVSGYSAALAALLGSVPQSESHGVGAGSAGRLGATEADGLGSSPLLSPSAGVGVVGAGRGNGGVGGRANGACGMAARGLGIPRSRFDAVS